MDRDTAKVKKIYKFIASNFSESSDLFSEKEFLNEFDDKSIKKYKFFSYHHFKQIAKKRLPHTYDFLKRIIKR